MTRATMSARCCGFRAGEVIAIRGLGEAPGQYSFVSQREQPRTDVRLISAARVINTGPRARGAAVDLPPRGDSKKYGVASGAIVPINFSHPRERPYVRRVGSGCLQIADYSPARGKTTGGWGGRKFGIIILATRTALYLLWTGDAAAEAE